MPAAGSNQRLKRHAWRRKLGQTSLLLFAMFCWAGKGARLGFVFGVGHANLIRVNQDLTAGVLYLA